MKKPKRINVPAGLAHLYAVIRQAEERKKAENVLKQAQQQQR